MTGGWGYYYLGFWTIILMVLGLVSIFLRRIAKKKDLKDRTTREKKESITIKSIVFTTIISTAFLCFFSGEIASFADFFVNLLLGTLFGLIGGTLIGLVLGYCFIK